MFRFTFTACSLHYPRFKVSVLADGYQEALSTMQSAYKEITNWELVSMEQEGAYYGPEIL